MFLAVLAVPLLSLSSNTLFAQAIEATVTLQLDALSQEKQQKLRTFADQVAYYINSYDWSGDPWKTIVYVDIQLILEDISSGAEEQYKGRILIQNNYDIQFFDQRWRFAYQSGENLVHNENDIDSFTNMIDFYLFMILGGEFDKWGTLAGSPYYEKARHIAEQAKFGLGRFIEGWDRRLDQVNFLLSDLHRPFREMVDFYFYGLSFVRQDNAKARKHCATAVKMLDKILANDPDNEYAQRFLATHSLELVEIFRRAQDKEPIRLLRVLDADSTHENIYREILNN